MAYLRAAGRRLRARVRADLGDADDRPAHHVRPADGDLRPPAAARPALLRPQPGRPPDDARHQRRRRPERSLLLRRRRGLRRRVHAGRHHGRAAGDGLAAGAGRVLGAAADRCWSRSGSARNVRESYRAVRTLDRADQRVPAGEHHRHGDGAAVPARGASTSSASTRSTASHRDANIDSIFYYAVFYPAIELVSALAVGADHLVRRRLGAWTAR